MSLNGVSISDCLCVSQTLFVNTIRACLRSVLHSSPSLSTPATRLMECLSSPLSFTTSEAPSTTLPVRLIHTIHSPSTHTHKKTQTVCLVPQHAYVASQTQLCHLAAVMSGAHCALLQFAAHPELTAIHTKQKKQFHTTISQAIKLPSQVTCTFTMEGCNSCPGSVPDADQPGRSGKAAAALHCNRATDDSPTTTPQPFFSQHS